MIPFASGHPQALWTVALLSVGIALDFIGVGSTYMEIQLLQRVQSGHKISRQEASVNDARQAFIGDTQTFWFLETAIAFLMWIHRAHRNLPSLGSRKLRFSPGWAVGYFFVPILNLFRPYQVMKEIWRGSDRDAGLFPVRPGESGPPVSPVVAWWWTFWIIMNVVGNASIRTGLGAEGLSERVTSDWVSLIGDGLSIIAALLAILVVRGVDANQQERHRRLAAEDAASAAIPIL